MLVLYHQHQPALDNIHLATLFTRLATLASQPQDNDPSHHRQSHARLGLREAAPDMSKPQEHRDAVNRRAMQGEPVKGSSSSNWHSYSHSGIISTSRSPTRLEAEPSGQLLKVLLQELSLHAHELQGRQISNILWALAKLSAPPHPSLLSILLHRASELGFETFKPQELCNLLYALALLQPSYTRSESSTSSSRPGQQHHLEHQQQQQPEQGLAHQQQQQQEQQQQQHSSMEQQWEEQHPEHSYHHQQQLQPQHGFVPWDANLLDAICTALSQQLPRCNAQDLSQALYSLALLQHHPPPSWLSAWLQAAQQLLPKFTPQGLANSAYALGRLVGAGAVAGNSNSRGAKASSRSSSSDGASHSSSSGIDNWGSLHSSSGSSSRAQALNGGLLDHVKRWLEHCMRFSALHLSALSHQELISQLMWACGQLGVSPPASCLPNIVDHLQQLLPSCSDQQLAALLTAVAQLQLHQQQSQQQQRSQQQQVPQYQQQSQQQQQQLPVDWWQTCWTSLLAVLQRGCRSSCLVVILAAVADLTLQPPQAVAKQLAAAAWEGMLGEECEARVVVGLLHGCARLSWGPPERWLLRFQAAAGHILPRFKSQDFANTAWALAVLGVVPSDRWEGGVRVSSDCDGSFNRETVGSYGNGGMFS